LTVLEQVEDNLAALRILQDEAQQQSQAPASAEESLQIFANRYIGGVDPYLQVITAPSLCKTNATMSIYSGAAWAQACC
jgi:outer membrane protein TolC